MVRNFFKLFHNPLGTVKSIWWVPQKKDRKIKGKKGGWEEKKIESIAGCLLFNKTYM